MVEMIMNICRISIGFPPRRCGWSNHAFYLSEQQAIQGNNVYVLQPYMENKDYENISIININIGHLKKYITWKSVNLVFNLKSALKCFSLHQKHHLNIIHCHGDIIDAFIFGLLGHIIKVPVICTIHSGTNRKYLYRLVARRVFKLIKGFVVVSKNIKRNLILLGIKSEKIEVISSGIKIEEYLRYKGKDKGNLRQKLGLPINCNLVVSVGNLDSMKGFEWLIKAAKEIDIDNLLIVIIGDGPERNKFNFINRNNPKLIFLGSKSHEKVIQYLCCADVFVLPSIDLPGKSEGTPTALIEAMAAGLPAITTDSGGVKYLIKNGINGYIVPQRDSAGLADAIRKMFDNPELFEKMGKMNQEAAKEKDWSIIAMKISQVYSKLFGEKQYNVNL